MIRIKKRILGLIAVMAIVTSSVSEVKPLSYADSTALNRVLDSMGISKTDLEAKVQSTLMFGGSAPVSFSGEGRLKLQFHQVDNPPLYMKEDKTYLQSGWEGNESFVRLGMVARAGRNAVLWTKIGFQHTLAGTYNSGLRGADTIPEQLTHKDGSSAIIHEDMNAGFAIRTVPASFWLKLGAVQWIEASPLTIWKSQPRTFAWEYLPFEVEQPIARYYEYNLAKGEKAGRAAWNKKALQGVHFESINLPGNLYFNFLWGTYERYDNFEREFIDFSNDIAYSGDKWPAKGSGIGDSYRHLLFSKIAVNELIGRLTPSVDFTYYAYNNDIYTTEFFHTVFGFSDTVAKGFYKEPLVASIDLRGPINDKLNIHANFALNYLDTTWVKKNTQSYLDHSDNTQKLKMVIQEEKSRTDLNPALYLHLESKYGLPINADIAVISKGFYSPLSFAVPVDAFFPFGSNLVGPGKFMGRGEGSPYTQNMAGINLKIIPKIPGYGHLKFTYGQHFQLEESQDVLFFPHRLNGQDLSSLFHSSYTRWGSYPVDIAVPPTNSRKYFNRMGDEGFYHANLNEPGPMAGGLRQDYLSTFEGFVPYADSALANANYSAGIVDYEATEAIYTPGLNVPKHKKFTFNFEVDGSYDIGPLVGYSKDLFVGLYGSINGISSSFKPLAFNEKAEDMMLWGTYLRFEPAIAVTKKFYVLGLAGFENWRAKDSYMAFEKPSRDFAGVVDSTFIEQRFGKDAKDRFIADNRVTVSVPLDYRDYAFGLGFDWDMLARVGLHGRAKWMKHEDVNFKDNNWAMPVISAEIKMWF